MVQDMMLLWVAVLLLGSCNCFPSSKGSGSGNLAPASRDYSMHGLGYSPNAGFRDSGVSSGQAGSGSYYGPYRGSWDEGAGSSAATGYGSSSEAGDLEDIPEPVFSDVSDLDPVYFFNSRSRYQHARDYFSQIHYAPTEVQAPVRQVSKGVSDPVKSVKGF